MEWWNRNGKKVKVNIQKTKENGIQKVVKDDGTDDMDQYDWKYHCVSLPTHVTEGCSDANRRAVWLAIIYRCIRRTPVDITSLKVLE